MCRTSFCLWVLMEVGFLGDNEGFGCAKMVFLCEKNGGLWKLKQKGCLEWRRRGKNGRKRRERGKRRERNVLRELWDPRSVRIPRLRIESLSRVTGVMSSDGPDVCTSDGRHEG